MFKLKIYMDVIENHYITMLIAYNIFILIIKIYYMCIIPIKKPYHNKISTCKKKMLKLKINMVVIENHYITMLIFYISMTKIYYICIIV